MDEEDELVEKIYITLCKDIGQEKKPDFVALDLRWTPSVSFHRFEERVKMTQNQNFVKKMKHNENNFQFSYNTYFLSITST